MIITGIDSDLNGGVVTINFATGQILSMRRVPTLDKEDTKEPRRLDAPAFYDLLRMLKDQGADHVILERAVVRAQGPMADKMTAGIGTTHQTFGGLRAICEAVFRDQVTAVWPVSWKSKLKLTKDKERSAALATELFPTHSKVFAVKKNAGLAEAVLIAHWGNLHLSAQKG